MQIAKALGAWVAATASREKRPFVEGLGADEVIDSGVTDLAGAVDRIDLVLDLVGGQAVTQSLRSLRPGGHLVTAVAEDDPSLIAAVQRAGARLSGIAVDPDPVGLAQLMQLAVDGRLRVHVQQTLPFDRVVDAHRLLDAGHLTGKLVLEV